MIRSLYLILFLFLVFQAKSQDFSEREAFNPSNGTSVTKVDSDSKKKNEETEVFPESLEYFLIDDPKKVLYGNPCVEEVIQDLGFRYMLIPETRIEGYINEDPVWHNFKTHVKLMFRNGPFYKSKVRKAIKGCRESSGDFVG